MLRWLRRKAPRLIAVLLAATALTFLMVNLLPGDVAYEIGGREASPEDIEAIREELGLNQNIFLRYVLWLADVARGDLGKSFRTQEPVLEAIVSRLPVTIELMIFSLSISLMMAIPVGMLSAYKARSIMDRLFGGAAFGMLSIPVFVMALLLIFIFALRLQWLPATGYTPLSEGVWDNVKSFILPGLSLALVEWVSLMRVLRSDMITTLQQDFILMAKAKGLPTWNILIRHALRPSSLTLITILGMQIGGLIGGAVIVETIFALPGIGRLLVTSIFARDFLMVQGCILMVAVGYVIVNFLVDVAYSILDPRIRMEGANGG
ncbi:MAG: ABC transporter permease [Desulfobacterales bacterium]|nr:ABC transporter permease [Desulfobacterales bacterium]